MDSNTLSSGVTVGICAYNEGMNIGKLLHNILKVQELPVNSEVLVVCSGCTDNTVQIVEEYTQKDARVQLFLESERKGKASAINHILSNAKGDSILFISADTLPNKGCFSKLASRIELSNVGIVCGQPMPTNNSDSLVGRLVQLLWRFHNHVFTELNDAGLARHATEIFIIRKGIVNKIPPETVNDDAYIALTAKKRGWLVEYETESRVSICGPKTFTEYFQQRRRIIYGHHQVKKLAGESPQHLMHLMPRYPIRVLKLGLWLFRNQDIPTLLVFIITEMMANIAATMDVLLRKPHLIWTVLPSTKVIRPVSAKMR